MKVEFDPVKDAGNIAKHGTSLAKAAEMIVLASVADERFDYGENRFWGFGYIDGVPYCLAYTEREDVIRAISLRRAHEKEFRRNVQIS